MTMAPTPSTPPPNRGRLRTKSKTAQQQTSAPILFLLLLTASFDTTNAFLNTRFHRTSSLLPPQSSSSSSAATTIVRTATTSFRTIPSSLLILHSSLQNKNQNDDESDDEEEASWDSDVTYPDLSTPSSPDPDSDWDAPPPSFPSSSDLEGKLGIDIGSQLNPLTPQEAAELKAEAAEMLNDVVAERMDEIDKMKETLKEEFEQRKQRSAVESQRKAERTAEELMSKIDSMSETFLSETRSSREGTKLASRADRAMEGKGMEIGSWGNVGGGAVRVEGGAEEGGGVLLGSVDEAVRESKEIETFEEGEGVVKKKRGEGKVLIVADVGQDQTAQKLLPSFTNQLTTALTPTKIQIETVKPSSTIPLGGNDAQTAILFLTSLTDRASINSILDRLLKRVALPGGGIGSPPSHIVAISTLGTARTDKFPYSMQNLMGGKLDKRRDMEEAVISTIQRRMPGVQPPMDYTIVKFGDLVDDTKVKSNENVMVRPGDVLDGEIGINAASNVLLQSLAYQPYARNATLSATGAISDGEEIANELWDDMFLRLNGPELLRIENLSPGKDIDSTWYNLVEYVNEWAITTFEGEKKTGLTTPVRIASSDMGPSPQREGVELRSGVKIVFLPTQTGSAYKSREEERVLERERMNPSSNKKSTSSTPPKISPKKAKLEGGIEVLVEKTTKGELRARARRCDMDDDTVVKEMSEVTILKRLREGIDVWSSKK